MVKQFFLLIGRIPNFTAPFLIGKLIVMWLIFASLRSKMLFFTGTMTVTIPFTIILIDEVGDFTIKMG
jgi:hypothetical protein